MTGPASHTVRVAVVDSALMMSAPASGLKYRGARKAGFPKSRLVRTLLLISETGDTAAGRSLGDSALRRSRNAPAELAEGAALLK